MLRCLRPCSTSILPTPWNRPSGSHRTLFSLPDFSSLSPFGPETQTYHERKILPYRQKDLYDIVADVGSYPRFVPFCTGSRIVESSSWEADVEKVMEAELTVGFLSFRESYVSKVTCKPYESVEAIASSSTPLFKTLSTTWRFQPASSHSPVPSANVLQSHEDDDHHHRSPTLVTLDLAYAFANPIHASVSLAFFGQVSKLMVKAFEERCLEVYGSGRE